MLPMYRGSDGGHEAICPNIEVLVCADVFEMQIVDVVTCV